VIVASALVGLVLLSFGLWAAAAFVFRMRKVMRFMISVGVPALFVTVWMWLPTVIGPAAQDETGWIVFYSIVSFMLGAVSAVMLLPVWYVAERKLGCRAC
jgi:hypothetical protein